MLELVKNRSLSGINKFFYGWGLCFLGGEFLWAMLAGQQTSVSGMNETVGATLSAGTC